MCRKNCGEWLKSLGPCTNVGDLGEIPGSWLQPAPTLAVVTIWGVNHCMRSLSLFVTLIFIQINTSFLNEFSYLLIYVYVTSHIHILCIKQYIHVMHTSEYSNIYESEGSFCTRVAFKRLHLMCFLRDGLQKEISSSEWHRNIVSDLHVSAFYFMLALEFVYQVTTE